MTPIQGRFSTVFGRRSNARRNRDRGVSTVLDVAICLLLISAAVVTLGVYLTADDDTHDPEVADRAAETIGSTTIGVEYSLEPAVSHDDTDAFDEQYRDSELERVTHGPAAGLLADAALANVAVDGERITHAGADFDAAIDGPLIDELLEVPGDVSVTATWTPYDGAPLEGRSTTGATPPPDVDVSTVTMTVPSGLPNARENATARVDEGGEYDDVARPVAEAVVDGILPAEPTQLALEAGGLERDLTVYRYNRFATVIDGTNRWELETSLTHTGSDTETANEYVIDNLTAVLESDLERQYETPEEAADAVSTGEVTIVVRVWNA